MLPNRSALSRSLQPGELLARSRVIPRVEMGAAGSYVLICPHEGELAFAIDSLEWFEWLCSLSSFRFVGHSGRFTAYREGQRSFRDEFLTEAPRFGKTCAQNGAMLLTYYGQVYDMQENRDYQNFILECQWAYHTYKNSILRRMRG